MLMLSLQGRAGVLMPGEVLVCNAECTECIELDASKVHTVCYISIKLLKALYSMLLSSIFLKKGGSVREWKPFSNVLE